MSKDAQVKQAKKWKTAVRDFILSMERKEKGRDDIGD